MGTQTRLMSGMDSAAEGLPFDPTIRIPPIQDPSPLQVVSNYRPSPLEPSAAEGRRSTAVHLTSRSKALASARPIGGNTPIKPLDTRHISDTSRPEKEERREAVPRKRQKVDYVQLPNPHQPTSSSERVTSIESIPRLNQLNEPPPSAARFPPITTNGTSPVLQRSKPRDQQEGGAGHPKRPAAAAAAAASKDEKKATSRPEDIAKKPKRVYTRGRRNWTNEETENLLRGVAKYGVGKWKRIMEDPDFDFPPDRTAVDLKDRYRTCKMHEERRIERHAKGDFNNDSNQPSRRVVKAPKAQSLTSDKNEQASNKSNDQVPTSKSSEEVSAFSFAEVNTVNDVAKSLATPTKSESKRWTSEEDVNLSKGFQKYGFSWTSISKDTELQLQHRTGTQLRDRFRIKFPIHYQTSLPVELLENPPGRDRNRRKRRRQADPKVPRGGIKVVLATPNDPKGKAIDLTQTSTSEQRSKTLTIADMTDDSFQQLNAMRPSLPSMSSLCAKVNAQPLPEKAQYSGIDIQPLPDSGDEFEDDSEYDEDLSSDQIMGDKVQELQAFTDDEEDVRVGPDVRHLSISGLLNETHEDVLRLPPFRSAYDDTNDILEQGGVQLPPLTLWDDLAPRPMFELD